MTSVTTTLHSKRTWGFFNHPARSIILYFGVLVKVLAFVQKQKMQWAELTAGKTNVS
jgi:hypothetical protein